MSTKMSTGIDIKIELPEKCEARIEGSMFILKGAKGELGKNMQDPNLDIKISDGKIILQTKKATKRDKLTLYTNAAHVKNMVKGVTEGHKYVLKICSSHFPMNVSVANDKLVIKNFIGEKFPRTLELKKGVSVKVEGDLINVESVDKELAGTTSSDIEKLTRRAAFDKRIFQDGIYIIEKDGKEIK